MTFSVTTRPRKFLKTLIPKKLEETFVKTRNRNDKRLLLIMSEHDNSKEHERRLFSILFLNA